MSGPIIVTALFGDGDNGWVQELRRTHYPPGRNRVPAHLTLFRHLPPGIEAELSARLAAAAAAPPPRARIGGVMDLGEGTALRVESEELEEIRADIAEALHGLLIPQDMSPWRPHVTIQTTDSEAEARSTIRAIRAARLPRIRGIGLHLWCYRDGPWEHEQFFRFR